MKIVIASSSACSVSIFGFFFFTNKGEDDISVVIVARLDSVIVVVLYLCTLHCGYIHIRWICSWAVHFSILCNLQYVKFDRRLNHHWIV